MPLPRTLLALAALTLAVGAAPQEVPAPAGREADPFARLDLPDQWERRFWADPNVKALLDLEPKALAALVPEQAGLRYCRCPSCDATEADDTLAWAASKPRVVTCRRCDTSLPNDDYPAKDEKEKKVPEEIVDVLPGVTHKYPYHAVDPARQHYPEERLYLAAKRDYEAREFLAKTALYAAVRHREQPDDAKDPALARVACVLLLRFAQVYPAYSIHYDQPGQPKFFQQADLPPPYRRGYRSGKWEWTASLDVPLNLVIAYALLRHDPALAEAGKLLKDPHPTRTIERDLFRASAEFVRLQPEEYNEYSLQAYRGLLAVGRLLDDPALVHEAVTRLDAFAARGFYHDGFWRQGDPGAHRRVMGLLDGWIDRLLAGYSDPPNLVMPAGMRPLIAVAGCGEVPMLALARTAGAAMMADPRAAELQQVSWPPAAVTGQARRPVLLGGAGLARLAVGTGASALDIELHGQDSLATPHFQRQAIRLAVGGRPVLGDLDDQPPSGSGWERSTASHNTVVVDGLNQRESPALAADPAAGGIFLFYAADPDFQVVAQDDPRAYPKSTTRYRQTLIAATTARGSYAIGVFEVRGGLQHDQLFHGPTGSRARWALSVPTMPGPASLLPPSITFLPTARPEDGRWFVQAYGEFAPRAQAILKGPATATLDRAGGSGVRLHLLGDLPTTAVTAISPDPTAPDPKDPDESPGRAGLILRRRSPDGATLVSTFVTVFEPLGAGPPLARVGRVASPPGTVLLYLETDAGPEYVLINLEPGATARARLLSGEAVMTDGLAVRATPLSLILAGGTFAAVGERRIGQAKVEGTIVAAVRAASEGSRGWFLADGSVPDPSALAGRVLFIRHGDGITRGWTLHSAENTREGLRLRVREETGFALDPEGDGLARYYQFPRTVAPGPHRFSVARMARIGKADEAPRTP